MLGEAAEQLSGEEHPLLPAVFKYEGWNSVFALVAIFCCAIGDYAALRSQISIVDRASGMENDQDGQVEGGAFSGLANCHHHPHGHGSGTDSGASTSSVSSHARGNRLRAPKVTGSDISMDRSPSSSSSSTTTIRSGLLANQDSEMMENGDGKQVLGDSLRALEAGRKQSSFRGGEMSEEEESVAAKIRKIRVMTLEAGILVHSVLIGLDLGLQSGSAYTALLSAITFHQFFEGFALSQILIEAEFHSFLVVALATTFYALTTPIGIAIGIGVRQTFDTGSVTACLTLGILDSLSGGILIYIGLTTLLANWIVNNEELARAPVTAPVVAFSGLAIGLAIMAVLGIWA